VAWMRSKSSFRTAKTSPGRGRGSSGALLAPPDAPMVESRGLLFPALFYLCGAAGATQQAMRQHIDQLHVHGADAAAVWRTEIPCSYYPIINCMWSNIRVACC
jgi:hypothetical protein